ncbi:MAG: hypothetical protein JXA25_17110 [Anaerolineales bacterium]|nr:hypothetical protein [Anaerolineales bacterium]
MKTCRTKTPIPFLLLVLLLILLLAACRSGESAESTAAEQNTPAPTSTVTPLPTPTSTPTPEPVFSYYSYADAVNAMAIDGSGSLWAATTGGLVSWNLDSGDYRLFNRADGLPASNIRTVAAASDGSIWAIIINSAFAFDETGSVVHFTDGQWFEYSTTDGLVNNHPISLTPAENGIWVGFDGWTGRTYGTEEDNPGGVSFFDGTDWTSYTQADGLLGTSFETIYIEPEGRVWAGSDEGINWFENGVWSRKAIGADYLEGSGAFSGLVESLFAEVHSITRAPDGSIWFGTDHGGARFANDTWSYFTHNLGLYLYQDLYDIQFDTNGAAWSVCQDEKVYYYSSGRWWWLNQTSGLPDINALDQLEPDPGGGMWFASRENGAMLIKNSSWTLVNTESGGLAADKITAILPLGDGTTLFSHPYDGISRLNLEETTLQTYQVDSGVPPYVISQILPHPDGTLWIRAGAELYTFDGNNWENYSDRVIPELGSALSYANSIKIAPDGTLWVGSNIDTRVFTTYIKIAAWNGQQWTSWTAEDGLPEGKVAALDVAPDGTVWALIDSSRDRGDEYTGVVSLQGETWSSFTTSDGFPSTRPVDLVINQNGLVWVSTLDAGLLFFDGSEWQSLTSEDGLPGDRFGCLFVDREGNLWACGDQGLGFYNGSTWKTYTEEDDLTIRGISTITQAPDGTMWFGTSDGAIHLDGSTLQTFTTAEGLPGVSVSAIACTDDGAVWFGTAGNGLTRYGPPELP